MKKCFPFLLVLLAVPAAATLSKVQSASTWNSSGSTCNVSLAGTSAGNLIVLWLTWSPSSLTLDLTYKDPTNNTYASAVGPTIQSVTNTAAQIVYAKNLPTGGNDNIHFPFANGGSATSVSCVAVEYTGADAQYPLDSVSAGYVYSGNPSNMLDSGNAAPANTNLMVFAAGVADTNSELIAVSGNGLMRIEHSNGTWGTGIAETSPTAISGNNILQRATACFGTGSTCSGTTGNWLIQMAILRDASWTVAGGWSPTRLPQYVNAAQYPGADICVQAQNAALVNPHATILVPVNGTQPCSVDPTGAFSNTAITTQPTFFGYMDFYGVGPGGVGTLIVDTPWLLANSGRYAFHDVHVTVSNHFRQNVSGNRCWTENSSPVTNGSEGTCLNGNEGFNISIQAGAATANCALVTYPSVGSNLQYQIHGGEYVDLIGFTAVGNNGKFRVIPNVGGSGEPCGNPAGPIANQFYIWAPNAVSCNNAGVNNCGAKATIAAPTPVFYMGPRSFDQLASEGSLDDWKMHNPYVYGKEIGPQTGNSGNYVFEATVAGTSGGGPVTWPQTPGATVGDGGVTWKNIGTTAYCIDIAGVPNQGCQIFGLKILDLGELDAWGYGLEGFDNSECMEQCIVDNRDSRLQARVSSVTYSVWTSEAQNGSLIRHGEDYCNNNLKNGVQFQCISNQPSSGTDLYGAFHVGIWLRDTWAHQSVDDWTINETSHCGIMVDGVGGNGTSFSAGNGITGIHFQKGANLGHICIGSQSPASDVYVGLIQTDGMPAPTANILIAGSNASPVSLLQDWAATKSYDYATVIYPNPAMHNTGKNVFFATVGGTSGTSMNEPNWDSNCATTCTDGTGGTQITWTNAGTSFPNSTGPGGNVVHAWMLANDHTQAATIYNGETNKTWTENQIADYTYDAQGTTYEASSSDTYPANFGQGLTVGSSLAMSGAPVQAAINSQVAPSSSTVMLDMSRGNIQQLHCTGSGVAITLADTNLKPGETMTFIFVQTSSLTPCTLTYAANMHGGTTVPSAANGVLTQEFAVSNSGTDLYAKADGKTCTSSCGTP